MNSFYPNEVTFGAASSLKHRISKSNGAFPESGGWMPKRRGDHEAKWHSALQVSGKAGFIFLLRDIQVELTGIIYTSIYGLLIRSKVTETIGPIGLAAFHFPATRVIR
jgi:hypothetical protein